MAIQRRKRKTDPVLSDTTGDSENSSTDNPGTDVQSESDSGTNEQVPQELDLTKIEQEVHNDLTNLLAKGTNNMSIFGNLDINEQLEINDDPYYIKPQTYWAVCTDCVEKEMDGGATKCVITWTIDEPDNEYHGQSKQEWYGLFKHRSSWDEYTPDEKKTTKFFRKRLREAFDLSETELASVEYSQLVGKGAFITLTESKGKEGTSNAGKTFVNVTGALSKRLYEEQNQESTSVSSSLGL